MIVNTSLSYIIQHYDFAGIGPENNLLATIGANNIASIEVLTDPATLAALGPLAVTAPFGSRPKEQRVVTGKLP